MVTVMMKDQILEAAQAEEEEHSAEMLKIFSQEAEQGITTSLEAVAEEEHVDKMLTPWEKELEMMEDWLNHPEPVDDCHEQTVMQILAEEHSEELLRIFIQGAEQMMIVMPRHATTDEGKFQSEEKLKEAGDAPAGELAEVKMSEEEAEKRLGDETSEEDSAAEWPTSSTEEEEDSMGDLIDIPICRERMQPRRMHRESQPLEQMDKVIEEIRRLMSRSAAETASEEKLSRRKPAIAAGQQQQ
jgi:hypothetical protein